MISFSQIKTYDPGFTQIEIWFRFIFLLFTFIVTCWFAHTLRRYVVYDWSIEQKWMSLLLPLLLFYNSKLTIETLQSIANYILSLFISFVRSIFPNDIADQFMVPGHVGCLTAGNIPLFVADVLVVHLSWAATKRTQILDILSAKMYCHRTDLVVCHCAGHLGEMQRVAWSNVQSFRRYGQLQCAWERWIYHISRFNKWLFHSLQGFKTFFYVSAAMYTLYLALLILKAYSELRSMPYFSKLNHRDVRTNSISLNFVVFAIADMRLKFLTLLMLFVLSISMTVTMSRFGFGVLEDNFVASLNTTYKSSAQFMCFYGLLNFYLYTMAYVYSPSGRVIHGKWYLTLIH